MITIANQFGMKRSFGTIGHKEINEGTSTG
jgi:hypothetical protein